MPIGDFKRYEAGYKNMWDSMVVRSNWLGTADSVAKRILRNKPQYQAIEKATGVPWFFVGALHSLEAALDFTKHLHNGDSLKARTRRVPAGRPKQGRPPFTWEESAIDALTMAPHELDKVKDWTAARMAYEAERYNGWGYMRKGVNSPYLWSGSNHYTSGKYVSDGKYDPKAVSRQTGVMVLLRRLCELDPEIQERVYSTTVLKPVITPQVTDEPVEKEEKEYVPPAAPGGEDLDDVEVEAPKLPSQSKSIKFGVGGVLAGILAQLMAVLSDWRVLAVLGTLVLIGVILFMVRDRWSKPDIIKR